MMDNQLNPDKMLIAYVYNDDGVKEYFFERTPENIANFIGRKEHMTCNKIILTDMNDGFILSTIGWFVDRSPDQELNRQIVKVLIPIQMGNTESQEIQAYTREELERDPSLYGGEVDGTGL
ncbi:MAG: hypothetical protein LBV12_11845 [Puniceicoccales bacterium]|jgi:hypothetical protein|nr:hypothetical protein [Puniceicoccales bacterium]